MTDSEAKIVVERWAETCTLPMLSGSALIELVHQAIGFQAAKAGRSRSPRKVAAVRLNGLKGGRKRHV